MRVQPSRARRVDDGTAERRTPSTDAQRSLARSPPEVATHLDDLLSSFRRHLRAAAKAPRTTELYSQSVRHFGQWLAGKDRRAVFEELTRHAISAWLAELAESSTVATRLRGMRRFCRWLVSGGELEVLRPTASRSPRPAR